MFEVISGLQTCLQYLRLQSYRRPVYRPKVVLGIVQVILYRLWPENNFLGNSAGADCNLHDSSRRKVFLNILLVSALLGPNPDSEARKTSYSPGEKKAHKPLTHKLFEKAVNPRTTPRLTRRNAHSDRRRTHKLFCLVNRAGCPGVNRTLTRAKRLCLCVFFSLPNSTPCKPWNEKVTEWRGSVHASDFDSKEMQLLCLQLEACSLQLSWKWTTLCDSGR